MTPERLELLKEEALARMGKSDDTVCQPASVVYALVENVEALKAENKKLRFFLQQAIDYNTILAITSDDTEEE